MLSYNLARRFLFKIVLFSILFAPVLVSAQTPSPTGCSLTDFRSVVVCVKDMVVNPLIALLVGLALVVVLWGVVKYIAKGDQPEERKKGEQLMLYGIIGLFVMLSVWGLVSIFTKTFFAGGVPNQPVIPAITL